jgi:hypothetical protein
MPCYDAETDEAYERRLEGKVHFLTRLLCRACQELERRPLGYDHGIDHDWLLLVAWWEEYRARGEAEPAQKQRFEAREELIARLSPAERELLGVSDRETFQLED